MYKDSQLHEFHNLFIYIFIFFCGKTKHNRERMTHIYTNKIKFILDFCLNKFVEIIKCLSVTPKDGLQ